jgi:hypothetical protein
MYKKIIIKNAGISSSDGEYIKRDNEEWFDCNNGNHIEHTIDGWFLVDSTISDQTYMFDKNFENVFAVGDGITPLPEFNVYEKI